MSTTRTIDRRVLAALAHPLRERILLHLREHDTTISAVQLARAWDLDVSAVSYHVKKLHSLGALRLVGRVARRGAIEHRYALRTDRIPQLADLLNLHERRRTTVADVGAALRHLRERQGTKPVQIGRAVGLDAEEIIAIEEGRGDPPLRTLIDLTECLDASLADIV